MPKTACAVYILVMLMMLLPHIHNTEAFRKSLNIYWGQKKFWKQMFFHPFLNDRVLNHGVSFPPPHSSRFPLVQYLANDGCMKSGFINTLSKAV